MDAVDLKQALIVGAVVVGGVVSIGPSPALRLANRQGSIEIPVVLCDQVSILYAAPGWLCGLFSHALRRLHGLSRFISRLGNVLRLYGFSRRGGLFYFKSFNAFASW